MIRFIVLDLIHVYRRRRTPPTVQGLREQIQAHNRLRPRLPQRAAPSEKLAGFPSALPKMRLLPLQAPLPLGHPPRPLQLKSSLACSLKRAREGCFFFPFPHCSPKVTDCGANKVSTTQTLPIQPQAKSNLPCLP